MKKTIFIGSVLVAVLIVGLALSGYLGTSITGNVSSYGPSFDFTKSIQVGIVLLASLGILAITLVNLLHKD